MDLVWRVVVDFLLQGRSMSMTAAVDLEHHRICFHDSVQPIPLASLKRWNRLGSGSGTHSAVSAEHRAQLEQAIDDRDVLAIRRNAKAALHLACNRVRVESQEEGAPRSIHAVWFSSTYHSTNQPWTCTYGPHARYASGATIVVTVSPAAAEWLERTFYTHPILQRDSGLFGPDGNSNRLASASHALLTPLKQPDEAAADERDHHGQSPMFSEPDTDFRCEVCYECFPPSLLVFVEQCGHTTCLSCATACSEKHCLNTNATLTNMPCPAADCGDHLSAHELRAIVPMEDAMTLEFNEVRLALQGHCATCPTCGCSFERLEQADGGAEHLRNRFVCAVCDTSFCVECGTHPFHEGKPCKYEAAGPSCRYCGTEAVTFDPLVCEAVECRRKGENSCSVSKQCGHLCHGRKEESQCTPCLTEGCEDCHPQQNSDDFCVICYCETLGEAPCIELDCGHVFHWHCVIGKLKKRWPTVRITFTFLQCPLCSKQMAHHLLLHDIAPFLKLRSTLESRYLDRLRIEKLTNCDALTLTSSPYYNQPIRYADENLTYYQCCKCLKPYFGGLKQCADVEGDQDVPRDELVCGGCSAGSAKCDKHGAQFMEYKCRYCCNLAIWYCWGTTHFCDICHSPPRKTVREECPGEERCPLGGKHRPNGEEFAVGCAICRSERLKELKEQAQDK